MVTSTAFKKGEKRPRQGRPKGCLNKNNQALRDMVLAALQGVGGVEYLQERANDPKTAGAFLSLLGKVLPMQVTGSDGGPVSMNLTVNFVPSKPA